MPGFILHGTFHCYINYYIHRFVVKSSLIIQTSCGIKLFRIFDKPSQKSIQNISDSMIDPCESVNPNGYPPNKSVAFRLQLETPNYVPGGSDFILITKYKSITSTRCLRRRCLYNFQHPTYKIIGAEK